jgi:hypothetical protein
MNKRVEVSHLYKNYMRLLGPSFYGNGVNVDIDITDKVTKEVSEEEARVLIELDTNAADNIVEIYQAIGNYRYWMVHKMYRLLTDAYPNNVKHWEETSCNYDFLASRVYWGLYHSFDIFNRLSDSPKAEHRIMSLSACSRTTLEKLTEDKSIRVRKEALKNMGPEALDKMLDDSKCEIRELGVRLAPVGYPKLITMSDDLSHKVIEILVSKIEINELPYILGNRNFNKNPIIRALIEKRLSSANGVKQ